PVEDPLGDARRLIPPLEQCRAEVHVVHIEAAAFAKIDRHALGAPGLAGLPGEIEPRVLTDREAAEDDVAELMLPQFPRRRHRPAHAERGAEGFGMTGPGKAGPDD